MIIQIQPDFLKDREKVYNYSSATTCSYFLAGAAGLAGAAAFAFRSPE